MNRSRFGKLIGVIDVSNSFCKFLVSAMRDSISGSKVKVLCLRFLIVFLKNFQVYAIKNREILTCHEISIGKIDSSEEEEYDPIQLWNAVQEVSRNLLIFLNFFFSRA
jgi:hypothetical protein